ncbi:MAG: nucleotide exchange factor GrpE [Candidatus Promineifilaceae bacterium]|nr:nucleotide exchange factor GrpE [Candidatus Promineifilaceae bacterium]
MNTQSEKSNNGQRSPQEAGQEALPESGAEPVEIAMESTAAERGGAETTADEEILEGEIVEDAPDAEQTLAARLQEAQRQAGEYLEGWQRARAEFANARRRMEKERTEARRNATVEVIAKLLPILDDFERALNNAPEDVVDSGWLEGMALIKRKLNKILESEQIERIETVGQPFDPNFHEAVMQRETDEAESGTVIEELQAGYRLDDRVIRPAMVVVAS